MNDIHFEMMSGWMNKWDRVKDIKINVFYSEIINTYDFIINLSSIYNLLIKKINKFKT